MHKSDATIASDHLPLLSALCATTSLSHEELNHRADTLTALAHRIQTTGPHKAYPSFKRGQQFQAFAAVKEE